jgi:hypothetical protein
VTNEDRRFKTKATNHVANIGRHLLEGAGARIRGGRSPVAALVAGQGHVVAPKVHELVVPVLVGARTAVKEEEGCSSRANLAKDQLGAGHIEPW